MGQWMSSGQVDKKDRAMLELKLQRDKLRQYEKKLSRVIHEELTLAKEQLKRNNHHAARLCLAKKKYQQSLLKKTEDQLFTLDQLTGALEFALVEQQVRYNSSRSSKAYKKEIPSWP
jgi:charged multivesicular body protein 6